MARFNFAIYNFSVLDAVLYSILPFLTTSINRERNGHFSVYENIRESLFTHASMTHKNEIMFKVLCIKATDSSINSIIAVDDFKTELIKFFIKYLNSHILQNLEKPVQFFENSFIHVDAE